MRRIKGEKRHPGEYRAADAYITHDAEYLYFHQTDYAGESHTVVVPLRRFKKLVNAMQKEVAGCLR